MSRFLMRALTGAKPVIRTAGLRGSMISAMRVPVPRAVRGFSTSAFRMDSFSDNLAGVLHTELDFEKKDAFSLDKSYQDYLQESGFQVVNTDKKVLAHLIKKTPEEVVHVYFDVLRITESSYDLKQLQESVDNEDVEKPDLSSYEDLTYGSVNVVVEKNGKATGFDLLLSLLNNEFSVSAITQFDDAQLALSESAEATSVRDAAYSGPEFKNLAEELQEAVGQFLVSRGIDDRLGDFILAYSGYKENTEYISWLAEFEEFCK